MDKIIATDTSESLIANEPFHISASRHPILAFRWKWRQKKQQDPITIWQKSWQDPSRSSKSKSSAHCCPYPHDHSPPVGPMYILSILQELRHRGTRGQACGFLGGARTDRDAVGRTRLRLERRAAAGDRLRQAHRPIRHTACRRCAAGTIRASHWAQATRPPASRDVLLPQVRVCLRRIHVGHCNSVCVLILCLLC